MAFHWLADFSLNFCIKYVGNYGVAIIILTILIKLIFWPLGKYKLQNP